MPTFFLPGSIVTASSIPEQYTMVTTEIERVRSSHSMHLILAGVRNQYFSSFTKASRNEEYKKGITLS